MIKECIERGDCMWRLIFWVSKYSKSIGSEINTLFKLFIYC